MANAVFDEAFEIARLNPFIDETQPFQRRDPVVHIEGIVIGAGGGDTLGAGNFDILGAGNQ